MITAPDLFYYILLGYMLLLGALILLSRVSPNIISKLPPKIWRLLFGMFFIIVGITFLYSSILNLMASLQSQNWPTTHGIIIKSNVSLQSCGRYGCNYFPNVEYSYNVNGTAFIGKNVTLSDYGSSYSSIQTIVSKYPVGLNLKVYYNPQNSSQAILQNGIQPGNSIYIVLSLAAIIIGYFFGFSNKFKPASSHSKAATTNTSEDPRSQEIRKGMEDYLKQKGMEKPDKEDTDS
ncbi:MAG: DUF3592 domain-containing protein [Candidatus Micrarchaeota archaeon]|nr:DUF3592 domain-containing protein [Candidatus Micrarchaeota archaeon]